jgi:hypothetical protein
MRSTINDHRGSLPEHEWAWVYRKTATRCAIARGMTREWDASSTLHPGPHIQLPHLTITRCSQGVRVCRPTRL